MPQTLETDSVRYVTDERGARVAAIVPIHLWSEISSEIETRRLLDNPVMRQRLLDALGRDSGFPLEEALRKLGAEDLVDETR